MVTAEPAAIVADGPQGLAELYVALTPPTRSPANGRDMRIDDRVILCPKLIEVRERHVHSEYARGYLGGTGPWAGAGAVGLADFLKLPRLAARTWARVDSATRRSRRRPPS
jgi:hypothetical protein